MKTRKSISKDLYYTQDHEWIDFQGSIAYVGVCQFKLIGIKDIQQIVLTDNMDLKRSSDIIGWIKYKDYKIEVHMPVDGKLVQINDKILAGKSEILLNHPETTGWIAKIIPSQPYERKNLLLPVQYQMNGKSKHVK